ncbi:MAG: hypothetical protein K6U74_18320 [Firmicutes bacterium]|nr:hypothetical protein [Bacillota bacterium]
MIWDYRNGYYVSEQVAPLRYRARRYLETRLIPVLKAAVTAAKPYLIAIAEIAALVTVWVALWLTYQLCRGVSWFGRQAHRALATTDFRRVIRDAFRAMRLREPWELAIFGTPIVLAVGCGAALLGALALAGLGAGRVVSWFEEFGGAE